MPFPSPGDLSDPGIEPGSPTLQADALPLYRLSHQGSPFTILKEKIKTTSIDGENFLKRECNSNRMHNTSFKKEDQGREEKPKRKVSLIKKKKKERK